MALLKLRGATAILAGRPCEIKGGRDAIDPATDRLFAGCRSKSPLVLDAKTGKMVAKMPIGDLVHAGAIDPETKLVFCSCGDGTVSVVHQEGADKYAAVGTIETKPGSKTMALDPKTHRLYLPMVEYEPAVNGGARPAAAPSTLTVLVFGK